MKYEIQHFHDQATGTLSYVVYSKQDALIIDPVLNFDIASGRITYESCEEILSFLKERKLNPQCILETHVHADHLSSSQKIKEFFPRIKVCISSRITEVQDVFFPLFNCPETPDGSQFDLLLEDHKTYSFGELEFLVLPTPGHTPACSSYLFKSQSQESGVIFTGDSLFMPEFGTGRCDFPKASATKLFESIQGLYKLPDSTVVYVGHSYPKENEELKFETTIKESKEQNIHIKKETLEKDFVSFRTQRDQTLNAPKLLLPSLQVNMLAGRLPLTEDNGKSYLKIPLKS